MRLCQKQANNNSQDPYGKANEPKDTIMRQKMDPEWKKKQQTKNLKTKR